jgi:tripartite-type tricarboxylate transporter receptor subunit TctC
MRDHKRLERKAHRGGPLLAYFVASGVLIGLAAHASAQETNFYAGKSIDLYIGYGAGSTYDLYARLMAEHIDRFLPGKPNIIARNMTGATSMRVMSYLKQAAKKDGTAWGAIDRNVPVEPLLYGSDSRAPFKDPLEFNWIGSLNTEVGVAVVWHTTGMKSWEEALTRPTIVGMAGAQGGIGARVLNSILDTKFQQVCCYGSDANQNLALERGEIEGRIGWSWSSLKFTSMEWLQSGKITLLMQMGLQKNLEIPADVPLVMDLVKTEKDKAALKIVFANQSMGRPYVMPPGVPGARVAEVQRAFAATMKDPAFLADAAKRRIEISDPKSGEEIEALLKEVYASSQDAVLTARRAIKEGEFKMKDEPRQ